MIDAESACNTLGYSNGGFYETIGMEDTWSEIEIPFLMDDVECESPLTTFSSCTSNSDHNCDHEENVLLTCFASGNVFIRSASWSIFGKTEYLVKGTDKMVYF